MNFRRACAIQAASITSVFNHQLAGNHHSPQDNQLQWRELLSYEIHIKQYFRVVILTSIDTATIHPLVATGSLDFDSF